MEKRELEGEIISDNRKEFMFAVNGRTLGTMADTEEEARRIVDSYFEELKEAA